MLQDIYPHVFCNDFVRRDPVPGDIALFFPAPDQVLLKSGENGLTLPTFADFSPVAAPGAISTIRASTSSPSPVCTAVR